MLTNCNYSSSSYDAAINTSNATRHKSEFYEAPLVPEANCPYMHEEMLPIADECRNKFRPEERNYAHLWFRVRRMNYEQLLWQLMTTGLIKKDRAYEPQNLPYWTISMRVKVKNHVAMGRVMESIRARLGTKCPGIRFCLDGFFGMRGYSDIFTTPDACPWMEVSNFSTVLSLRLSHGDNVFISVASPAQISDVTEWRRKRALLLKEPQAADQMSPPNHKQAGEVNDKDDETVIGKIAYDSQVLNELM